MTEEPELRGDLEDPPHEPWWRCSPPKAASAALAIGLATSWFADMLSRVPLDERSAIGFLLMLPLLLIVPAFSAAGLRLAWLALTGRTVAMGIGVGALALAGAAANLVAMAGFATALMKIFAG